jgi:phage shock protein A
MQFLKRLFKIGQAEVHSAIDGIEDPIKMTEQGIRDMKQDLDKSLEALAQVKAMSIRAKNEVE